ncbi:GntR family transcriptional regulator [Paracoccus sp. M683]|uniref:GntR family transcriptional regulator n=1 Tax=Paracoccus sp. M683 TaxID=2594268 RepID=UPI00163D5C56|nr:GntR family transcriptional regulator [Paracoccus sp. M683]
MAEPKGETAADRAYRILRSAILSGRLPTDRKVTEAGLAEMLDLSRTPVRNAVGRLLIEGLLQRRKGSGLWCILPTRDEIRTIFDIRARLESYAAARAAEFATPLQRAELVASAARMALLVDEMLSDPHADVVPRIDAENALFHCKIVEAAHARRLELLLQSTIDVNLVTLTLQAYGTEQRMRSASHHHEIAVAIAGGMVELAGKAMEVHILSAASFVLTDPQADHPAPRQGKMPVRPG